jgi:uncharacterized membrane protein
MRVMRDGEVKRAALALLFMAAGIVHLVQPALYRPIMPPYLPAHDWLILISGWAEILGGTGLLVPATRRLAGWGLMALLLAVFPANLEMLWLYRERGMVWWGELLLWLRLPLQALLLWWVWRAAGLRRSGARY